MASQSVLAVQYKNSRFTATASLLGTYITDKVEHHEFTYQRTFMIEVVEYAVRVRCVYVKVGIVWGVDYQGI